MTRSLRTGLIVMGGALAVALVGALADPSFRAALLYLNAYEALIIAPYRRHAPVVCRCLCRRDPRPPGGVCEGAARARPGLAPSAATGARGGLHAGRDLVIGNLMLGISLLSVRAPYLWWFAHLSWR